ncbi:zinc dependent phospholipase C family protein [Peptoniphilaceae bacterium SGI.131]
MASIYTHNRFGLLLRDRLNEDLKKLAESYPSLYLLGQQGPDLFFFSPKSLKLKPNPGSLIHDQNGEIFLNNQLDILGASDKNSPEAAYMLGSMCHFILDSHIHPTVNNLVTDTYSHIDIESELDRYYLLEDGHDPFKFYLNELIPKDPIFEKVVYKFYQKYDNVDRDYVMSGINYFRKIKKWFHAESMFKENFLKFIVKLAGQKDLQALLIRQIPFKEAENSNRILAEIFDKTLDKAAEILENTFRYIYEGGEVPLEYKINYNGEKDERQAE